VRRWRRATAGVALGAVVAGGLAGCSTTSPEESFLAEGCVRADFEGRSVARVWDEALLDAIRRDAPAPTVHSRNLFHTSAAMWDAWAAYDPHSDGYFVQEKLEADDVQAAREAAISYAAYRVLLWRYSRAAGLQETLRRAHRDDEVALLLDRLRDDRGRLPGRLWQPDRRRRHRARAP